jgi:hypothetical protein
MLYSLVGKANTKASPATMKLIAEYIGAGVSFFFVLCFCFVLAL